MFSEVHNIKKILVLQGKNGICECNINGLLLHWGKEVMKMSDLAVKKDVDTSDKIKNLTKEEREIIRLKLKTNRLLEVNRELRKNIENLKAALEKLLKGNQDLNSEGTFEIYFKNILNFLKYLNTEAQWLEFKNNTFNKEYRRIEKKEFERIFNEAVNSEVDYQQFVKAIANMGILKSVDGKEVFSANIEGKTRRVYMIRKSVFELPGLRVL